MDQSSTCLTRLAEDMEKERFLRLQVEAGRRRKQLIKVLEQEQSYLRSLKAQRDALEHTRSLRKNPSEVHSTQRGRYWPAMRTSFEFSRDCYSAESSLNVLLEACRREAAKQRKEMVPLLQHLERSERRREILAELRRSIQQRTLGASLAAEQGELENRCGLRR